MSLSQPTSDTKRVRIAIIGAGPAGINTFNLLSASLAKSKTAADILLINDKDSTFNNVASPRALADPANAPVEKLQYPLAQLVAKPTAGPVNMFVIVGMVESVNTNAKEIVFSADTPNGIKWIPDISKDASSAANKVAYDYLVIALGSSYHAPVKPAVGGTTESFAEQFTQTTKAFKDPSVKHVVVAGLGIVGIEIAGEIKTEYPDKQVIAIGPALLAGSPPEVVAQARAVLAKKNISIIENCTVDFSAIKDMDFPVFRPGIKIPLTTRDKSLSGTDSVTTDCLILATGIKPNSSPLAADFPLTDKGYVRVNTSFQVKDHPNVFALGDIIQFPEPGVGKLAYLAGEQAKVVAENLAAVVVASAASAAPPKLRSWSVPKLVIISSIGRDAGIGYLPGIKTKFGIGAFMGKKLKGGDGGVGLVRHIKQSRFVPALK